MFEYVKTYTTLDYNRLPSYDSTLSFACAFNYENEQPINSKNNEGKNRNGYTLTD